MTTALDARLAPKVVQIVGTYGTLATFTEYPAASVNTDDSIVTQGSPTTYERKVTPPKKLRRWSPDGAMVETEAVEFYLPTGEGTSSPVGFTPALGGRVTVSGVVRRITAIDRIASGDLTLLYRIEAQS